VQRNNIHQEIVMTKMPKEIIDSQKATVDAFMAVQGTLFSGFEKLVDLNLKVIKATMDEVNEKAHEAMDVKDAQEAVAMSSSMVQPSAEKAMAYSKHVYDIVSGVQAELSKVVEGKIAENQKQVSETIDQMTRNAPSGSESAVAMLKSSMAQANAAYESMTKAAKQAADVTEKNLHAATAATMKAASDAATGAAKTAARATTTRRNDA